MPVDHTTKQAFYNSVAQTVLAESHYVATTSNVSTTSIETTQKHLLSATFELAPVANERAVQGTVFIGQYCNAMDADGIPVKAFKIASGYIAPRIAYLCKKSFLL